MVRLREEYLKNIRPNLIKTHKYKNIEAVPRLQKIVLNIGLGQAVKDKKLIDKAIENLSLIAGQRSVPCVARKSIAGFKLREGMVIGTKVTLRKTRMYEFLDRLINIAMPSIRDFRGLSDKSFDGKGNYAMGIKEHIIFPEIDYEKIDQIQGLDIVFVTTANDNKQAKALLAGFNMPFMK